MILYIGAAGMGAHASAAPLQGLIKAAKEHDLMSGPIELDYLDGTLSICSE